MLAVGLVLLTASAVALVAHLVVGLPWGAAFVLGAILAPTDPAAAQAVFITNKDRPTVSPADSRLDVWLALSILPSLLPGLVSVEGARGEPALGAGGRWVNR